MPMSEGDKLITGLFSVSLTKDTDGPVIKWHLLLHSSNGALGLVLKISLNSSAEVILPPLFKVSHKHFFFKQSLLKQVE